MQNDTWNLKEIEALHGIADRAVQLARRIDALVEDGAVTHEGVEFLRTALREGRHIGVVVANRLDAKRLVDTLTCATACMTPDRDAGLWQHIVDALDAPPQGAVVMLEASCACHAMRALLSLPRAGVSIEDGDLLSAWLDLIVEVGQEGRVERIAAVCGPLNTSGLPNQTLFARRDGLLNACWKSSPVLHANY